MPTRTRPLAQLLADTRTGDATAWGQLLEHYRPYLTLLARVQIGRRLRVKADPADVVQEAFLQAHRSFALFRGTTSDEFLAWLLEVLASRLAKLVRHYLGTQARDLRLERELVRYLSDSSHLLDQTLAAPGSGPCGVLANREDAVRAAAALEQLPPDHREVIVLRHVEELTFPEVGRRMGRTTDAVTQLWVRAIQSLRAALEGKP